jgi:integrase
MSDESVRETVARWVEDSVRRLRHDPVNARSVARIVERFLNEAEVERVADLRPAMLLDWLGREAGKKRPRTVRNELAAIRQWSRYLAATEVVGAAPFESVRVARCDSDDGCDAISHEQAEQLVANARAELHAERWQIRANAPARLVAYLMMIDAGLRIGEVRRQRWEDVDLARRTMRISADKAGRRDLVEIGPRLAAALRWLRWRQSFGDGAGEMVIPCGPNAKKLRADLDRIGCSGEFGRFHRLRKFAITSRAIDGWGMWELTRFARHRDPKTTLRYVRPAGEIRSTVIPKFSTGDGNRRRSG